MASEKGQYDTFDSGSGPVIPEKAKGDFAHQDSDSGLNKDGAESSAHGAVPEVPQSK